RATRVPSARPAARAAGSGPPPPEPDRENRCRRRAPPPGSRHRASFLSASRSSVDAQPLGSHPWRRHNRISRAAAPATAARQDEPRGPRPPPRARPRDPRRDHAHRARPRTAGPWHLRARERGPGPRRRTPRRRHGGSARPPLRPSAEETADREVQQLVRLLHADLKTAEKLLRKTADVWEISR